MNITAIEQAKTLIAPYIKRTPLDYSESLSRRTGLNIYVKYELFQKTGAFKARGAFNKLLSMSGAERAKGVVAVSGGNHAQAVAHASSVLGIDAVILMPETTPANYVEATRALINRDLVATHQTFHSLECGENIVMAPAGRPQLFPIVEIARMTADPDHVVYPRRPAKHPPARYWHA